MQDFDPQEYLSSLGVSSDDEIDLLKASMALVADLHPGISFERYDNHVKKLSERVGVFFDRLVADGDPDNAETRRLALEQVFSAEEGYIGDQDNYDHISNADIMQVIDRRKGLPIALGILCIQIGRLLDWDVEGMNMPAHFLCRINHDHGRVIFDPFQGCLVMEAPDLRTIVKQALGKHAELSSSYYEAISNREILIRLQNNMKLRFIEGEDYAAALQVVDKMRQLDPNEYRLLLDAGVLLARLDKPKPAIDALADYIKKAPNDRDRHDAAILLQQLRETQI